MTSADEARPRLFVRVDAGSSVGMGHFMRCVALAQAWMTQAGEVFFIGNCQASALRQRLGDEGFGWQELTDQYPGPADCAETIDFICQHRRQGRADWLVLDGYHFDVAYQQQLRASGVRLLIIDDNHHLPFYHADAILNPNLYGPDIAYQCPAETLLLLGGRYTLLRTEFQRWQEWQRTIPDRATRIFVVMGGGDQENVTLKTLEALFSLGLEGLEIRAVVGHTNPNCAFLQKAAAGAPCAVELLPALEDMPAMMAWADMAVTAAGQTCLELACMGVPGIMVVTADNQETAAALFRDKGIFETMGRWNGFTVRAFGDRILRLINAKDRRRRMSENGRRTVSSSGSANSVAAMLAAGNRGEATARL